MDPQVVESPRSQRRRQRRLERREEEEEESSELGDGGDWSKTGMRGTNVEKKGSKDVGEKAPLGLGHPKFSEH